MTEETKSKAVEVAQRRGPLGALPKLEQEMERIFGGYFPSAWQRPWNFEWPRGALSDMQAPKLDVVDRETEVLIRAELAGFSKEDINVSLSDNSITIKASAKSEEEKEDGDYHRKEISSGYVSRTVALPADVKGDEAKARFSDGMLEIRVPKAEKSKRQNVEIEA